MQQLSKVLNQLSVEIVSNLDIISETGRSDKQRKIRILEMWNSKLSPAHERVANLDDYGKCVVHGYKSMINKHIADTLSYDDFLLYVFAVVKRMHNDAKGDWNEKR